MDKQIHDIKPTRKAASRRAVTSVPSYTDTDLDLTPKTVKHVPKSESADVPRSLMFTLQFLAYAIPLGFLAYVLYINYLPFGYEKTFTIDVGAEGDTRVGEFYLEPSPDLSERKTAPDGTTYRELNGMANIIFKPNVVLKDAEITVSVEGEGVEIIPPVIDFNPEDYEWDYEWDFTNKETAFTPKVSERARSEWQTCQPGSTTTSCVEDRMIPKHNIYNNEDCLTFSSMESYELLDSADLFENDAFTIYVKWKPKNSFDNFQQIIGHYNWEIIQDANAVKFQVGRLDNNNGVFSVITAPIDSNFFNTYHTLIVKYSPLANTNGYIEMYLDGKVIERKSLNGSKIFTTYGEKNLTFGKSFHGQSSFFEGNICNVSIVNEDIKIIKGTKEVKVPQNSNYLNSFIIQAIDNSQLNNVTLLLKK